MWIVWNIKEVKITFMLLNKFQEATCIIPEVLPLFQWHIIYYLPFLVYWLSIFNYRSQTTFQDSVQIIFFHN